MTSNTDPASPASAPSHARPGPAPADALPALAPFADDTARTADVLDRYREQGHVTVSGVLDEGEIERAVADVMRWVDERAPALTPAERAKFFERSDDAASRLPRWIDHPVRYVPSFEALARSPRLVRWIETLIGPGVDVYFSQVFFKPPGEGSPKPAHQDNAFAGPNDPDGLVTAWIALDDATPDNGCLQFVDGSHRGPVLPHRAPPGAPYHLQIDGASLAPLRFTWAPVGKGGVSFHHGGTIHRSGPNRSAHWRRAAAITYVTKHTVFADPKLAYDPALRLAIT